MDPFFILGAPRSGTTMLRDCFKKVENVYSPEETHFFRWSCPFRGNEFNSIYRNNKVLLKHREIDGVSDEEFDNIVNSSLTKKEVTDKYCFLVSEKKGCVSWFDKTPQNVYGLPLIAEQYPDSKIVHIVRNPYSVIKSLLVGKVLKVDDVVGAANYWAESVSIVNVMKPYLKERLIEVKYEDFVLTPDALFKVMCEELNVPLSKVDLSDVGFSPGSESGFDFFSSESVDIIKKICGKYMSVYGY